MTHIAQSSSPITTQVQFETEYGRLVRALLSQPPVERGAAHAMKDDTTALTHELMYLTQVFKVPKELFEWQRMIQPNLPWADDHFQERVSGQPLNPAPSEAWWPFARAGNAEHKKDEMFSHTYPERFWPRMANVGGWTAEGRKVFVPHTGIRFEYGDLDSLIEVLRKNPRSRQAYLPIWFPEDLAAAVRGERVPCSMGYHFIYNDRDKALDCVYTLRSCDIVRFYRDDMYMAGRLLQSIANLLDSYEQPGKLIVHIDNLHCFPGDAEFLRSKYDQISAPPVKKDRSNYNFEAM